MAEEIQISGSQYPGKIRNPLGAALLPFVTFGIYGLVWYYKTNKELAEMGKAKGTEELGTSPGMSLLAVTLGAFLLFIPPLVSQWNFWKRLVAAQKLTGQEPTNNALGFIITLFVAPIGYFLYQDGLNKVLQAQLGAGTTPPAVQAPAAS